MNTEKKLADIKAAGGRAVPQEGFLFSDLSADVHRPTGQSKAGCQHRDAQISERLRMMPRKYRSTYRRAIGGKSLRACVNACCLECCGWQSGEVTRCTDLGCPLYAVRPYQDDSGCGHERQFGGAEGPNGVEGE